MKFLKFFQLGTLIVLAVIFTGCASIVSKSKWPVTFKSDPSGAEVTVSDEKGKEIHQGITPVTFTLPSGDGFFTSKIYLVNMKLDGYGNDKGVVKADLNGWYFGNIFIGGLIGMLIVDPATGAMWKLPKEYSINLSRVDEHVIAVAPLIKSDVTITNSTGTNSP